MHTPDTKSQFLELRAKGWSLARIAEHLQVSQRTLVDWNRQHRGELHTLRALQMEAVQEKILATQEQELTQLVGQLKRVEDELSHRQLADLTTRDLFRLAALLRAQLGRLRIHPDELVEAVPTSPSLDPNFTR